MKNAIAVLLRTAALLALAANPGCTCTDLPAGQTQSVAPAIKSPWTDDFNRASLGPDWMATDPAAYRIEGGELVVKSSYNHPLWLSRPIPENARIEFDCWSNDEAGDLKVEVWGDGHSFSTDKIGQYTSTAYNFIFGGWHNQISTLARMHEHGDDRQMRRDVPVVKNKHYHWVITRRGGHIEWTIDGAPFFTLDDPEPLRGSGHDHFAVTDWEAELHFDNLKIEPL